MNLPAILMYLLAGLYAGLAVVSFSQWVNDLDVARVVYRCGPVLQSRFTGRRANYLPWAGQVWRSSDPRRLSAFRVVSVDHIPEIHRWTPPTNYCANVEIMTHPGATGRTAKRIPVINFATLGAKGYTRVA